MRYLLRRKIPKVTRILLVESGSRHLIEKVLVALRRHYGDAPIDLLTCYAGEPKGPPSTESGSAVSDIFRVSRYPGRTGRSRLFKELRLRNYALVGILCSGEPILPKWKWGLAARLPAKVFIINENGDFFWLDYAHWRIISNFASGRVGLSGADAVRTLVRLAVFPFTFSYLLLYAAIVHLRRKAHG